MATKRKAAAVQAPVIELAPIPSIPIEYSEPDEAKREEAWQRFLSFAKNPPKAGPGACPPGQYGTRDEWYEDRGR